MGKSVAKNALYNSIRTISSMLFPLITFPYASRVLLAENLGKVDFSTSFVSYFSLIASLGISTYAMRSGAQVRDDKEKLDRFASQILSINMVSTVVSYLLLAITLVVWPHLQGYFTLVAVRSVTIIATTLGVEWVYTIEEDYGYITLRTIAVQIVSAVLLFALVRRPSDYVIYAGISVFSSVGANVFNLIRSRRYVKLRFTWDMELERHLVPILILFGNAIATTIYINVDVTLLNVMCGDREVGIYSTATRIYSIIKSLLNSLTFVAIPRLSFYRANGKNGEYDNLLASVAHGIIVTLLPVLTMLFLMADYAVLIVAGSGYVDSTQPLRILCLAAMPAICGAYTVNGILLTNGAERLVLGCTIVGAAVNFILNLFVIPSFGAVGAAVTTAIAEACVFGVSVMNIGRFCDIHRLIANTRKPMITTICVMVSFAVVYPLLQMVFGHNLVSAFASGFLLMSLYVLIFLVSRDSLALEAVAWVKRRIAR